MKYFLWIDGKQSGPYESTQIREMVDDGRITLLHTLGRPEEGPSDWNPIGSFPDSTVIPKAPTPSFALTQETTRQPEFSLPAIEDSKISVALDTIGTLTIIGAVLGGFGIGFGNSAFTGWVLFLSGLTSGLILLGLAAVIDNTNRSKQYLERIEKLLIQKFQKDN